MQGVLKTGLTLFSLLEIMTYVLGDAHVQKCTKQNCVQVATDTTAENALFKSRLFHRKEQKLTMQSLKSSTQKTFKRQLFEL